MEDIGKSCLRKLFSKQTFKLQNFPTKNKSLKKFDKVNQIAVRMSVFSWTDVKLALI